ncbi:hypothetical protein HII31_02503 [Pseudocercospora fuligena]|uniref:Uncharacterized protein n=1 Tax=Pseudocercospora fuligena TaxID=685502 RepID=A0A8H6RSK9_9PEZI|nr:hypothetical protein HII31_02503 [Pseudocercospora fuligena]
MSANRRSTRTEAKEAIRLAAARNRQGDDLDKNRPHFSREQWCTIIFLLILFGGSIFGVVQELSDALGSFANPVAAIVLLSLAGIAMFFAWPNGRRASQSRLQIRPGKEIKQEWQWPNKSAREDGVLRKPRDQKRADRESRKASPSASTNDERRDSVLAETEPKCEQGPEIDLEQEQTVDAGCQVQTAWRNLWEDLEAWTGMAR